MTRPRPAPPLRRRVRALVWVGVGMLVALAAAALLLSAGALVGRGVLEERIAGLEARLGCEITIGDLVVDPFGGLRLEDVTIRGIGGAPVDVRVADVETDLDLPALARGARRPSRVVLSDVSVDATLDAETAARLRELVGSAPGDTGRAVGGPGRALDVLVEDAAATLRVPGVGGAQPFALTAWSGALQAAPGSAPSFEAHGLIDLGPGRRHLELTGALGSTPWVRVVADAPIGVEATLGGRAATVQITAVERRPAEGKTVVDRAVATSGDVRVACDRLIVADDGRHTVPRVEGLRDVLCTGATLRRGPRELRAERAVVALQQVPGDLPTPRRAELEGVRATGAPAGVAATARALRIELSADATTRLRAGDLLGAVAGLDVVGPTVTVPVPDGRVADADALAADELTGWLETASSFDEDAAREQAASDRKADDDAPETRRWLPFPLPSADPIALPFGQRAVEALRGMRLAVTQGHVALEGARPEDTVRLDDLTPS